MQVRETNRKVLHLDLAECLASACYISHMLTNRPSVSFRQSNQGGRRTRRGHDKKAINYFNKRNGRYRG